MLGAHVVAEPKEPVVVGHIEAHVAQLLDKLGLDNRVQAAVYAVRHGVG